MNIAIITNSSSYEPRAEMAAAFFQARGDKVVKIESDFVHREKVKKLQKQPHTVYINTLPYYHNLSMQRLYSHYDFSRKVSLFLEKKSFDLIYVLIPANSLMKYMALYKGNDRIKLIVDIIDLWPESLPFRYIKKIWPITIWADMRNKYLKEADYIITECALYQEVLKKYIRQVPSDVIYWTKEFICEQPEWNIIPDQRLHLCYLGSINNILDINFMVELIKEMKLYKEPMLHIIGEGEKKGTLIEQLKEADIFYHFYGPIYEEKKKMRILSGCHYGLNIMKSSVRVGMTMKAVDYMYAGLPLINNIAGDTWDMIEKEKIGYNCNKSILKEAARLAAENCYQMKQNRLFIHELYLKLFSREAYNGHMEVCMKKIMCDT